MIPCVISSSNPALFAYVSFLLDLLPRHRPPLILITLLRRHFRGNIAASNTINSYPCLLSIEVQQSLDVSLRVDSNPLS